MDFDRENNYNEIAEQYKKTEIKPDKKFSILPTVLKIAGDVRGKTVLDLGCGDGFFTEEFGSAGADKVIGVDNSQKQIDLARSRAPLPNVEYIFGDIFTGTLPPSDIINSPFVLNYAETVEYVDLFLQRLFQALNPGGKLILVIDLPSGISLEKFGAKKTLESEEDGAQITIELFNNDNHICTLHATYFKQETIRQLLISAGFENIIIHKPIISEDGISQKTEDFWNGYTDNCELGYITAEKPKQTK